MPPLNSKTSEAEIVQLLNANSRILWGEARTAELNGPIVSAAAHIARLFAVPFGPTDEMPDYIGVPAGSGQP